MTGEASPGYMNYGEVPARVQHHLPDVRVIVMVRDPVERAYSSYWYNYRQQGGKENFENLVDKQIDLLNACFAKFEQYEGSYEDRASSMAVLRKVIGVVDLERDCFHKKSNSGSLVLHMRLVSRSLYAMLLASWYKQFPASSIHVVCAEELDASGVQTMSRIAALLGLAAFNFSFTISNGHYNVGSAREYRSIMNLSAVAQAKSSRPAMPIRTRQLLTTFMRAHNELLWELAGHRCQGWAA